MFDWFRFFLCTLLSLYTCLVAERVYPPSKVIRLTLGVSKATYLPLSSEKYLKDGKTMESDDQSVCKIGGWTAKSYENRETEVLMFKHEKQKIVVFGFRGTESTNLNDWSKNFDMRPLQSIIGKTTFTTHKGFRERYGYIASWFEAEYRNVPEDYTIVLTGHSLGGAEATIAAVFAAGKLKRRPDAVVTYGSPLIGKNSFTNYYKKVVGCDRTIIITAKFDMFVSLPFGYSHPCPKMEVDGKTWPPINFLHAHDLYKGYEIGIQSQYRNTNEIEYGCDKILNR